MITVIFVLLELSLRETGNILHTEWIACKQLRAYTISSSSRQLYSDLMRKKKKKRKKEMNYKKERKRKETQTLLHVQ